jgi:hypothetical protein
VPGLISEETTVVWKKGDTLVALQLQESVPLIDMSYFHRSSPIWPKPNYVEAESRRHFANRNSTDIRPPLASISANN